MKKITILAFAMGLLAITSCNDKKEKKQEAVPMEQSSVTDSIFQKSAAGEYKSLDGSRIITINSDFSVATKGLDKDYYKWEFVSAPQDSTANIFLNRKGLDADVQEQALLDLTEGKLVIKNETFRKGK